MTCSHRSFSLLLPGARAEQQDACVCLESETGDRALYVLADGVGGHGGGRLASRAVIEVAERLWDGDGAAAGADPAEFLDRLAREAHDRINRIGVETRTQARSTLVALAIADGKAHWIHSGDSRLYHFRDGDLAERTEDHSVVQILVARGRVTEEEMGTHPDQGRLLQALGGEEFDPPDHREIAISRGRDVFLLCSDGLWERLDRAEIARLGAPDLADPGQELRQLAELAVDRGGEKADNLSAILVRPAAAAVAVAVETEAAPAEQRAAKPAIAAILAVLGVAVAGVCLAAAAYFFECRMPCFLERFPEKKPEHATESRPSLLENETPTNLEPDAREVPGLTGPPLPPDLSDLPTLPAPQEMPTIPDPPETAPDGSPVAPDMEEPRIIGPADPPRSGVEP